MIYFLSAADYMETVNDVTFTPGQMMTCAEIPIVADDVQEIPETFSVGFGTGGPATPGPSATSIVTIIDPPCKRQMSTIFSYKNQFFRDLLPIKISLKLHPPIIDFMPLYYSGS